MPGTDGFRTRAHCVSGEGGREQSNGQDENRAENARQVLHKAVDGRGQPIEAQRFGRRQQERQHQDPENDAPENVARRPVHVDAREHVGETGPFAQPVEADDAEQSPHDRRNDPSDDIADEEDDQRRGKVGQEGDDFRPHGHQARKRALAEIGE